MNKLLLVCLLALAPVSLASADLKVAVVDLNKVFEQYYKTKDENDRLKVKEQGYQKQLTDLVTNYQLMGEEAQKLDAQVKDLTLSQAARDDKAKALEAKKQDLMNMNNKIQEIKTEDARQIQDELLRRHKEIVDEITKVVNDYSGPQGYDLVVDKSSASAASGVSIVLYNSNKLTDITADIITKLNATAPVSGGASTTGTTPAPAAPVH